MAPLIQDETSSCKSSFTLRDSKCQCPQHEELQDTSSSSIRTPTVLDLAFEISQIELALETKPTQFNDVSKSDDPFLYYSNDDIRLKAMKQDVVPDTVRLEKNQTRKTRLSFEMDTISLAMDDMMMDEAAEDDFLTMMANSLGSTA